MQGRVLIYVNYSNLDAEVLGREIQKYLEDKYGVSSLMTGVGKFLDLAPETNLIFAITLGMGTVLLASSLLLKMILIFQLFQ